MFRIMRKSMLRKLATALTSNVLVFRNGSFNEDYSYRKESNKMTPDFIGTWTCSFDEGGLATLIFNHGGTVIYQEYDSERRKKTEEAMNYTYNEGILSFYPKGKSNPETAKVVSLTSSKLILQDWPEEGGNCTFYKQ